METQTIQTLALGGSKAAGLGVFAAGKAHFGFGLGVCALAGAVVNHAIFVALDGREVGTGERIQRRVAIHRAAVIPAGWDGGRGGCGWDGNGGGRGFGGRWSQRNRRAGGGQSGAGRVGGRAGGGGRHGRIAGPGQSCQRGWGSWLLRGRRGCANVAGFAGGNGRGEGLGGGGRAALWVGDGTSTRNKHETPQKHINDEWQVNFRHGRILSLKLQ